MADVRAAVEWPASLRRQRGIQPVRGDGADGDPAVVGEDDARTGCPRAGARGPRSRRPWAAAWSRPFELRRAVSCRAAGALLRGRRRAGRRGRQGDGTTTAASSRCRRRGPRGWAARTRARVGLVPAPRAGGRGVGWVTVVPGGGLNANWRASGLAKSTAVKPTSNAGFGAPWSSRPGPAAGRAPGRRWRSARSHQAWRRPSGVRTSS